nr:hypothetical protein Iba_chr03bCG6830 [Ipomoea batatas]
MPTTKLLTLNLASPVNQVALLQCGSSFEAPLSSSQASIPPIYLQFLQFCW